MKTLSATLLGLSLVSGMALADTPPAAGPRMNDTVFSDGSIASVIAVTQVFGASQRVTFAIVELAKPVKPGLSPAAFTVDDRKVTGVKVVATPDPSAPEAEGRFVVLTLHPADAASVVYSAQTEISAQIAVHLAVALRAADGSQLRPGEKGVLNTKLQNLVVDDFQTLRLTDPGTGLSLDCNLFSPKDYDPAKTWPLVMFLHDAGVTGINPRRTLQQGLGAIAFASPQDQARHPAFVLAPEFPVALVNDAGQTSAYVEMLPA